MVNGTVKWFSNKKGFGFINSEDDGDDFLHFSAVQTEEGNFKTLYENDKVEFEGIDGEKGPQASNVVVTEHAPRENRRRGKK